MQTRSPGPLTLSFLIDDGLAFDLQEVFFWTAKRQEGQTNFQSLKALNFAGSELYQPNGS